MTRWRLTDRGRVLAWTVGTASLAGLLWVSPVNNFVGDSRVGIVMSDGCAITSTSTTSGKG